MPPAATYQELGHGITLIDAQIQRPGLAACYLIQEGDRAAFVETGTALSVPGLLEVLEHKGITRDQVDYVIPTHVHLDHAGGAGALMSHLPQARLVIHPRGARHMIDPSKLIAGATAVYGEEAMARMFGEILPIPEERVIQAQDGDTVSLNGRTLTFLDTPGHAKHHFSVVDEAGHGAFSGDTFGLSYREFDTDRGAFALPTTTPVQFDPDALHASVDRLVDQGLDAMYLTHYGRVNDLSRLQAEQHEMIDAYVDMARAHADAGEGRHEALVEGMMALLVKRLRTHGCDMPEPRVRELLGMDVELNVQGLEFWLDHE
ncbi:MULTISPECIES: MBL fold metallo-hydrolase [Ectothiorhodospira]|uniref:MBL fold metallo-hydrolase n=1 Tax=Ectothiorhodospira TaxID=1051 RepID=UPI001EE907EC|nr:MULTISPECIES: MBL fold metallo-hydrolase [Ectothiorhodospira]MCG5495319.1 MBL fold metallo-hydrolase [Ectothiorhodospira variabilis]MCG5497440.1 MBL fold metallo-hydrolase [Ectothiorhodospira variabilis]MCG5504917.1 MBL fold metallo-hydrolase [Ectothiorhodospira variabilis]MCG5508074.1 MBL fold metallo-hydrolase [Ectothiorhodospira variabilis]MCG5524137.1 MBL fold metallo-hydrolase [Ectothiorhodospira haloalkaliphila]